jgi:hypothetical protein
MKKNTYFKEKYSIFSIVGLLSLHVSAQFVPPIPQVQPVGTPLWNINATIRPRGEIRHGLGNPVDSRAEASAFISQRTNLNVGFRFDKLNANIDFRDVRVWGQDASSINNNDGSKFFIHQAWVEWLLASNSDTNCPLRIDNLSLKLGRQEIIYDDSRLFGNLDWLQQGRRHDAAILKIMHNGYQIDLGGAFNQNTDAFGYVGIMYTGVNGYGSSGNVTTNSAGVPVYVGTTPPSTNALSNQYRSFKYIYATRKFNQTKYLFLFFNDDFQRFNFSSNNNLRTYIPGKIKNRFTVGGQISTQFGNATDGIRFAFTGGGYVQYGENPRLAENASNLSMNKLNAQHYFGYLTATKGNWSTGPGYELLTGNETRHTQALNGTVSQTIVGNENKQFDPLYGTPHRWWGYMDYFYVGTGDPSAGLANYYWRIRYAKPKWSVTADLHHFASAYQNIYYQKFGDTDFKKLSQSYGQEYDLVLNYQANRFTNLEFGYCFFLNTPTLAVAKNINPDATGPFQQWTYIMLTFRPDFLYQKPVPLE